MKAALVVMAKAPIPGLVKTRLIAALGAEGAAHLAQRMLFHTLEQANTLEVDHLELCVSPDTSHPVFQQAHIASMGRLVLAEQGEGDLGERMNRALSRVLRVHDLALLFGTDAPALSRDLLCCALAALCSHDAVFVPAFDGGYVLVGLRRPAPSLFLNMTWSHPKVLTHTRLRAMQSSLTWLELDAVHDIDGPDDLTYLPLGWLA